jgi:hypothetical protein
MKGHSWEVVKREKVLEKIVRKRVAGGKDRGRKRLELLMLVTFDQALCAVDIHNSFACK